MEEKKWYVVNTYSGHEAKVKEKLDMRINSMDMQENIFRVIVPERKEVEIKDDTDTQAIIDQSLKAGAKVKEVRGIIQKKNPPSCLRKQDGG